MTTPADIGAIRERADAFQATMAEWKQTPLGTQKDFDLIEVMEEMRDHALTDRVTLLDANAQQAERVRTLEAALRPFAALLPRYEEYVAEKQAEGVNRRHMLDFTEWLNLYGQDPDILSGQCRRAADALAANADAGNGGA